MIRLFNLPSLTIYLLQSTFYNLPFTLYPLTLRRVNVITDANVTDVINTLNTCVKI